ncbi:hypothetical protein SISNIDRAFT_492099 [Sistotremastrum niveocremeum HHB9708]|uniref:Uncharacterized protein n=1 Tax=Sistotremastrum niveocremeum HHB9708 TaxID=1314777 RepID=A0A164M2M0_9AGAM|nr:hypothetical protein SISNIDRAFT_492099 [Sistotremastrum niveocremeum HHB9708]
MRDNGTLASILMTEFENQVNGEVQHSHNWFKPDKTAAASDTLKSTPITFLKPVLAMLAYGPNILFSKTCLTDA